MKGWGDLSQATRDRVRYVLRVQAGYCDEAAAKYGDGTSADLKRAALDEAEGFRAADKLLEGFPL